MKLLRLKFFLSKLLNTFKIFDFSLRNKPFKKQVNLNLNENLKIFPISLPEFDIHKTNGNKKRNVKRNFILK